MENLPQRRRPCFPPTATVVLAMLLGLAACAAPPIAECPAALAGQDVVYVLARGWHTEIGVPADQLQGRLAVFRAVFPGAKTVMFGYGKRTFMVAHADRLSEYVLGPVPGPALIEVAGVTTSPGGAFGPEGLATLALPPGGATKLSDFLWNDLQHDPDGAPKLAAPGHFPGSLFYAAQSRYTLLHTCNTWVAEALEAAGLPVGSDALVFSGQTMSRVAHAADGQCRAAAGLTSAAR